MRVIIEPDYQSISNWAANYVAKKSMQLILQKKNLSFWVFLQVHLHLECTKL